MSDSSYEYGLCIDGGGVGGIGPASFLAKAGLPLPKFGAGTSVGSMIIAMMAVGIPQGRLPVEFQKRAKTIFAEPAISWRMDPRKPKFPSKGLEAELKNVLGASTRISDTQFPIFIVSHDWVFNKPKVWDSWDGELLWECVAASCSAPAWFPPCQGLADGGTIANNPAMVAICGAKHKLNIPVEQQAILSLGTNGDFWKDPHIGVNTSKLGWAEILLSNPTRGNEMLATFQAQTILEERFLRLEPILSNDYGLADLKFMSEYGKLWEHFLDLRSGELGEFKHKFV